VRRNRSTRSGGIKLPDDRRRIRRGRGAGVWRTLRALGRLARARGRMEHVPTRMQVRATGEHAGSGRRFELVALPDGGAFDLLGMSG